MDKFAIFDMDGTLIESMTVWNNLAIEYLNSKGFSAVPEEVIEAIKPMTVEESAVYLVKYFNLDISPSEVYKALDDKMNEHYRTDIEVKAKVPTYLKSLKNSGYKMCVASSANEKLMDICLTRLNIRKYFEFTLSCETVGVGKSEPTIYYEAMKRLGGNKDNTTIYEDSTFSITTAKKAGFKVVAVFDHGALNEWEKAKRLADDYIDFY